MRRAKLGAAVILFTGLIAACSDPSPPAGTVVRDVAPTSTAPEVTAPPETTTATNEATTTTEAPYDWGPVLCERLSHPAHHEPCPAYVAPPVTSAPQRSSTATTAAPQRRAAPVDTAGDTPPDYVKQCESGGDYGAVNPNGHYGAWQFSQSTWESVGGSGRPDHASAAEQDNRAAMLWAGGAGASHWSCA